MRLQVLDEAVRFRCGSCTACCDQPWLTLIEVEKAEALDRHDFSAYPQLAGRNFYNKSRSGRPGFYTLAKGEGTRCLFLDTDGLCIIHKELGPQAKPHMCRQFPYLPARTWTDDRVSANFGCPSVQGAIGPTLPEQHVDIAAIVQPSSKPTKPDAPVRLDTSQSLTQQEYEAVMDRCLALWEPTESIDVWTRFGQSLAMLMAVCRHKSEHASEASRDSSMVDALRSGHDLPNTPDVSTIDPFPRSAAAPLPVRFLFAMTLYPDTIPPDATARMGWLKRLTLVPKLMSLARLSGVYASRLLGRNECIDDVLAHPVADALDPAASQLLTRYFRARLWQRMLVGTRLSIVGGVHQHILDFNAILFYARAEARRVNATRLNEALIRQALTRVEFHLANQTRVYADALSGWINGQLSDPGLAWQSLRLMAMKSTAEVAAPMEEAAVGV